VPELSSDAYRVELQPDDEQRGNVCRNVWALILLASEAGAPQRPLDAAPG
jgi:hypothetical protein